MVLCKFHFKWNQVRIFSLARKPTQSAKELVGKQSTSKLHKDNGCPHLFLQAKLEIMSLLIRALKNNHPIHNKSVRDPFLNGHLWHFLVVYSAVCLKFWLAYIHGIYNNIGLEGKWSLEHTRHHFFKCVITWHCLQSYQGAKCCTQSKDKALAQKKSHVLFIQDLHVFCATGDGLKPALWLDTPYSERTPSTVSMRGGRGLCRIITRDWLRIRKFTALSPRVRGAGRVCINTASDLGGENEPQPAIAPWSSQWGGCCNKLSECPAGAPFLWSSGWRGGLRGRQPRRRGGPPRSRRPRRCRICPDHRWPASPGTCSPNGACHGCTSCR